MQRVYLNPWKKIYQSPQVVNPYRTGSPRFALYIDVEATNHCNMKCLFCVRQQMSRPKGFMDIRLFREICKQAKRYGAQGIRFSRWGEPLLHPGILGMIETAKKSGLLTYLATNGLLCDKKTSEGLMRSGLDCLNFSMQGVSEREYNALRNNRAYSRLKENIVNFALLREREKTGSPFLRISTTITNEKASEINRFRNDWARFVDEVGIGYTWFKRLRDKSKVFPWLRRAQPLPTRFRCFEVMYKLNIDWDGMVTACCLDYDRQLSLGRMQEASLLAFWQSPQLKALRSLLLEKRQDLFLLCSTCELNYGFRGAVD
jgi:MoaA/NifB/PqqE/SkfB family radical SAM enzyme